MQIQNKLPNVGTSIFTVMSQLATKYQAINLGQGFPDFMMSNELIELVNDSMKKGNNQYAHSNGLPLLRERIAEKCNKLYYCNINPEQEITITPGGTYAIYTALTTVLQPNDEVIIFEPAYDSYIPNIEINGAKAIHIHLSFPTYQIPWQEVKNSINHKTRMIIINSPHNPTGAVLNEWDIEQLRAIVNNTNIIIVSDEVYEHLIYDNLLHQSILRFPDLYQRSFVCFSFGKTYHCTGWKLGYCIAPKEMMQEFRKVHQFNCFSCDTPKQLAIANYLTNEDAYKNLGMMLQEKRNYFRALMQNTGFNYIASHGSYFECYSYQAISTLNDKDFAIHLVKKYGVAIIPVSAFYKDSNDNQVVRFCFAKQNATLEKAAKLLANVGD